MRVLGHGIGSGKLESLTGPTIVIHGLVNPLVRPSGVAAAAKPDPNSRLLTLVSRT